MAVPGVDECITDAEPTDRRRRGRRAAPLVAGVGYAAFAAYRLAETVAYAPGVWTDSHGYEAVARHPWLSGGLWVGQRAPLVPLMLKLVGGDVGRYEVLQGALAVVGWGLLAWTAGRLFPAGWRRALTVWAVLGFAAAPLVAEWDWSVLSESPSLSCLAVLAAAGIWISRRFTWPRLALLAVAAAGYEGLRDSDIWTIALAGAVLIAAGLVTAGRGIAVADDGLRAALAGNLRRARPALTTGLVLVAISSVAGVAAAASHRNLVNIEETFEVRIFPFPDRVTWFAAHGMPDATALGELADATPTSTGAAKVVTPPYDEPNWSGLRNWLASDGMGAYALYLATHPAYFLTAPFDTPALTFNNLGGQLQRYQPAGIRRSVPVLETIFDPNRFVVATVAALAILLGLGRELGRRRPWRFLVAFGFLGLVSMLLAWHGEGREVTRHMVEGDVEVRLAVMLLALLALIAPGPARAAGAAGDDGSPADLGASTAEGAGEATAPGEEADTSGHDREPVGGPQLTQAARTRRQLSSSASGMTRTPPTEVMKLVSPDHRGTTWRWRCLGMPAPAARPRLAPRFIPSG